MRPPVMRLYALVSEQYEYCRAALDKRQRLLASNDDADDDGEDDQ